APSQPSGGCASQPSGDGASPPPPFVILAKALRPPPEKWHGLADTEIRYRQRYLDLMANPDVKDVMLKRSEIIREIRNFLHARGYVEVETPMMQEVAGGASAPPFITKHYTLGCDFYLRIALELYLKRLLVGGVDKVFEIGRNFRNEGLSRKHNPEFTMLEAYQAFGDYETMMKLVEEMICHVAEQVLGTLKIETKDAEGKIVKTIDLTPNWKRAKYKDLIREKGGADWFDVSPEVRRQRAHDLGAEITKDYEDFEVTGAIFEKLIEPTLIQPTFVTHLPKELVPLAKLSPDDPTTVEVFECCINGQEISPGYTEQNDPIEQRERLEHQAGGEQQKLDEDFLIALEHGMPPAGGIGIGIDRLCMMLLGQESIRDVILFPQLKPKTGTASRMETLIERLLNAPLVNVVPEINGARVSLNFSSLPPSEAGVYLVEDVQNNATRHFYVGETTNLEQRLRFLFRCNSPENPHPCHSHYKTAFGSYPDCESFCHRFQVRFITTKFGRAEIEDTLKGQLGTNRSEFYRNYNNH
ncbi:MAG TPA: lysine--tRNA ligase, partial [Candidatus Saccharimonadales bacterium]|nr:lysine--tRNA ligase [Candidatus Saccharimonadales bacterium]